MTGKKVIRDRCYIGLATTFHDPSVAIVNARGEVVFAEATERYLQNKRAVNHSPDDMVRLPKLIKKYCGDAELVVAHTWLPSVGRKMGFMSRALRFAAPLLPPGAVIGNNGFAWPVGSVVGGLEFMARSIARGDMNLRESPYLEKGFVKRHYDHHLTHAATACYTGPFEEAACAIVDGLGGDGAASFFHFSRGRFTKIKPKGKWSGGSLGHFYSIVCRLCGFDPVKGEEWKVMGLAPYGQLNQEIYQDFLQCVAIDDLKIIFKLPPKAYLSWLVAMRAKCAELCKTPEGQANIAHTGQVVFEEMMTQLLNNFHGRGLSNQLVLAGGCALNSAYNGKILDKTGFQKLHVPSAPGDDGCSLGAALLAYYEDHPEEKKTARFESPYLGSEISQASLQHCVQFSPPARVKHLPNTLAKDVAAILAGGGIIGWMQGKAEFGPRALGNRSILADPRPLTMKDAINARVKFREKFRPFAPAILHEFGPEYFHQYEEAPYMERTLLFKEEVRARIPAVVHENGTGRLQSVTREWSPKYYDLIRAFYELTGVPVLLNTSFNVMGKPIVHSVEDALGVFHTSGLDALVIDDYVFTK